MLSRNLVSLAARIRVVHHDVIASLKRLVETTTLVRCPRLVRHRVVLASGLASFQYDLYIAIVHELLTQALVRVEF